MYIDIISSTVKTPGVNYQFKVSLKNSLIVALNVTAICLFTGSLAAYAFARLDMPFKDKEFDYARCHHVIEHTEDPAKACSELVRIARGGILSFPPPQAELMFGRKEHRWFVFVDKGRLLFVAKRHPSYGIERRKTGCTINVDFEWKDSFKWTVVL